MTHLLDASALLAHNLDEPGADAAGLVLVHRDPHFDSIPGLKVLRLPDKR